MKSFTDILFSEDGITLLLIAPFCLMGILDGISSFIAMCKGNSECSSADRGYDGGGQ
jgi:hypothetical protein